MQSAGNLRRKRKGRVEGENERGMVGGRRVAWRRMRNYWRLIQLWRGSVACMSGALHDWNGGELLPLIVCSCHGYDALKHD